MIKNNKSYWNEKGNKGKKQWLKPSHGRPWPTDAAAWDLETLGVNGDPGAICAINLLPLFKGSADSFFYLFANWCCQKKCSLEKVCLCPFYLFTSRLFGILLLKPGAGDCLGCHMICRVSVFIIFYSPLSWCVPALRVACVTHGSLNVCSSGA